MIRFPDESPLHFSYTPGKLVLVDPNLHEIAQVDSAKFREYLDDHGLCSAYDIDSAAVSIRDIRLVFLRSFKPFLQRYSHLPMVKLPSTTTAFGSIEFNGYNELYSKQSIQNVIVKRLHAALLRYSFVAYKAGLEEDEVIGAGRVWREWFLVDVLGELPEVTVVVPPGVYPNFTGAVVGRRNAEPLSTFLEKLPHQSWRNWASPEELIELTS